MINDDGRRGRGNPHLVCGDGSVGGEKKFIQISYARRALGFNLKTLCQSFFINVITYSTYCKLKPHRRTELCVALTQTTMPDISAQKLREQEVGEAFIREYNRHHNTDYLVDREYHEEFPDIKFKSESNTSELVAEVVQVVESESQKANESFVASLQTDIKAELENRECRGMVVAILYETLPSPATLKGWIHSVISYVQSKRIDLKQGQFKFDRANDSRSFWDISHIKNSIRLLQIKLVENYDKVAVVMLPSQGRQMFPDAYLANAIIKKANKYSPDSIREVILLLDCNFPAIEEADMKEFAGYAQKNNVNPGFKEIWCVNILLNRTIVQPLV
jgi:hypothetical protein